jgi:hypothetical protein
LIYFRKFWFATKWSTQPINEGNDIIIPIEKMQTYSNTFCAIIYRCKLSCNVLVLYVLIVRNNTRFVCTVLWTLSFSSRQAIINCVLPSFARSKLYFAQQAVLHDMSRDNRIFKHLNYLWLTRKNDWLYCLLDSIII